MWTNMCRECICPETEDEEDQMDGKCTLKQDMLGVEAREDEVFDRSLWRTYYGKPWWEKPK